MILVTGATGFTGGHLARRLVRDGHAVRALVRTAQKGNRLAQEGIDPIVGDLRDPDSLRRAVAGVDVVYHIAASFRQEKISDEDMWAINCDGVRHLLDASIDAGTVKRFVHCSTIGVHGHIENPPATEEAPIAPGDIYQASKLGGEQVAEAYMREGRLPITIFRPGGIYGPGDMRFLKLFRAIKKRRFFMIGSGDVLYTLIYIDDLVEGIIRCGRVEQAVGNIYILTGEPPLTLNQLTAAIAEVLGVTLPGLRIPVGPVYAAAYLCEKLFKPLGIEPPLYRRRVDFFRKDRAFSIAKARNDLGFSLRVDVPTGLAQTAHWYTSQGLL